MKLLLDTHTLVWALAAPDRLSRPAREALSRARSELYVSVASAWELAILDGLGRVRLGAPLQVVFTERIAALRIRLLGVQLTHLAALSVLPQHHRDPFDRLLVSTALAEGMALVSADGALARYGANVLW